MSRKFDTTNWRTNKIITLPLAARLAELFHSKGNSIVSVNGSFDILHAGHLDQLEEAKRQGDVLFVGINSDKSVREGKGHGRPFVPAPARAAMLAALACTDYIVIIDEPYNGGVPLALLEAIKPQVHVNGYDYGLPDTWVEWPVMQKYGIRSYVVRHRNKLSTSDLVVKICNARPEG